ncbi:MAG TPA: diguanylate cyclase [Acidimicrobiales bacterium]|nr:diguanylate cyclase [Acidimicrobiales bacterium]
MNPPEDGIDEVLRLARDLCMGTASFAVSSGGVLRYDLLQSDPTSDLAVRVEALARSSLERPGARGTDAFWNAEVLGESDSADDSLACVAVPVHGNNRWLGLLGVVDTWLPELDEEQRQGLLRLSQVLGQRLAADGSELSTTPLPEAPPADRVTAEQAGAPAESRAAPATAGVTPAGGFLGEVAEHLPDGLLVARADGTVLFANAAIETLSGRATADVLGADVTTLFLDDGGAPSLDQLVGTPAPGRRLQLVSAEGLSVPVEASGTRFTSSLAGECFVALLHQARAAQVVTPEAQLGGAAIADLLNALDEGIVLCDSQGTVLVANAAAKALQGLPVDDDLEGRPFPFSPSLCSSDGSPLTRAHHPLVRALHGTVVRSEQLQLAGEENERRHIVASAKPFSLGTEHGALLVLRDVTSQLEEEAWLMHLALHDPLTGLANRYLLLDYLRRVLLQFRTRGGSIALVFLDLDDFKLINDRFGHDVGDEVLVAVGRRIQGAVRSSDIVARLGGDEFVVAHAASEDPGEIDLVVSRIRKTLTAPYQVRGQTLAVSASIGWVAADPRHEDPTTLLVRADREMYRRKSARNRSRQSAT